MLRGNLVDGSSFVGLGNSLVGSGLVGLGNAGNLRYQTYGVSWDKGSSPTLMRTDDAVGMTANVGVGATPATNDFDTAQIYSEISEVTDGAGNVFIRIPKFYIKKTDGVGSKTWQISKAPMEGGYLPACFNGVNYIDVAKYPASLSGDNKLQSVADVYPLNKKTMVEFRGYAEANGAGYQLIDIHVFDVLRTLFVIEFATLNSQAIMRSWTSGRYDATHTAQVAEIGANRIILLNATADTYRVGCPIGIGTTLGANDIASERTITSIDVYDGTRKAVSFDGAPVDIAVGNIVYNHAWKNGATDGVVASSGSLTSNSTGFSPFHYRGIENIYGNISHFTDGVNFNGAEVWVCSDPASYQSDLFAAPYVRLGYDKSTQANNYIVALGHDTSHPYAEFPTNNTGGSSTTYYCDYYFQAVGPRVLRCGATWLDSSFTGLFINHTGSESDDGFIYFGSRLVRKGG